MTAFENWQVIIGIIQSCILLATCLAAIWIGLKQNEINQNLLDLQYAVSVEVTYGDHRVYITNKTPTNIWLWGTQTADNPIHMEQESRLLVIGGSYYIDAPQLEAEALKNIGLNGDMSIPFKIFLKNQNQEKYIVKTLIVFKVRQGKVSINTQIISSTKQEW